MAPRILRLDRILSDRGLGSRQEISRKILQGRIWVNSVLVKSSKAHFPFNSTIHLDGLLTTELPLLAVYHKPLGVHSTMMDPWNRPCLNNIDVGTYPFLKNMHPVGRLDSDTTGLLLFSSCGQLTTNLLNPSSKIAREYRAIVDGKVSHDNLKAALLRGVATSDGTFPARLLSSHELADNKSMVQLTVEEGKYRMVRRILHNAGHSVLGLHRTRYGPIALSELACGEIRINTPTEESWAHQLSKQSCGN